MPQHRRPNGQLCHGTGDSAGVHTGKARGAGQASRRSKLPVKWPQWALRLASIHVAAQGRSAAVGNRARPSTLEEQLRSDETINTG